LGVSKKSAQQIEKQTEDDRDDQHRNDRHINAHAVAFVTDVARQSSEPGKRSGIDQQANEDQADTGDNNKQTSGAIHLGKCATYFSL